MPNYRTIIILLLGTVTFYASRYYQKLLTKQIALETKVLAKENKLYYQQIRRQTLEVVNMLHRKQNYLDSFSFIKTLLDTSNMDTESIYDKVEIIDLLNIVTKNTTLKKMKDHHFHSSLEIYEEAFTRIKNHIDSLSESFNKKNYSLIVEKVNSRADGCHVTMFPIYAYLFKSEEFQIYDGNKLLDIDSIPFIYNSDPHHLSLHISNRFVYEYK